MTPEEEELEAAEVEGRDRNPGLVKRAKTAPQHFAGGTLLPRVQAILNPALFRERGDTSRLVESVLGEDGALRRLAETNPDMAAEIRQQADTPMTTGEHQKFRSSLLGLVNEEVARNQKTANQLGDNKAFYEAASQIRGFLPGAGKDDDDPSKDTREEYEWRAAETLYKQAQEVALIDPDHSASLMGEARKKFDALTDATRTDMEKQRRVARAEDSSLWSSAREKLTETEDVIATLENDLSEKGLRRQPSQAAVARATALLGRAGDFPSAGISDAGEVISGAIPGGVPGGGVISDVVNLAGKAADKALEADDVRYMVQRLKFNAGLVQQSYTKDRAALADKYKASGLQFGEKPGEIYSVPNEAYTKAAEKIKPAAKKPTDDTDSLRGMLTDEVSSAQAAVAKVEPEASANVPGAAARLAAARERLQIATDDSSIFEDDQRQASGQPPPVVQGDDASVELTKARQRRAARQQQHNAGLVRKATVEALRGYTR